MTAGKENLQLNNTEFLGGQVELESLPVVVNLATTARCNINPPCVMCLRNTKLHDWQLSRSLVGKVKSVVDAASVLILHGVGEPLVYSNLFELARMAPPDSRKLFTTNGLLVGRYIEEMCDCITKISISIDAASRRLYRRIRHGDLREVQIGINRLVAAKHKCNQSTPEIDISMCLMRANIRQASDFVEMGYDMGVDTVHFYHLNEGPEYRWKAGWFNYQEQHCSLAPKAHDRAIMKALEKADRLGVRVIFDGTKLFSSRYDFEFADNPSGPPIPEHGFICEMPWRNIQVNSDGKVMNCCYQTWAVDDLASKSFADIWNGETQQAVRKGIVAGELHDYCKNAKCPPLGRV